MSSTGSSRSLAAAGGGCGDRAGRGPPARAAVRVKKRRVHALLAVLGPGIITANVDNDAGGIATYSIAGAHFGYSLLWTLVPITIALIVVQEMSARLGAITGKGLGELIRENFGLRATFYLLVALLVTDIGNTVAEFAGWAPRREIFGVPRVGSRVPLGAIFVWWLVVKGNYQTGREGLPGSLHRVPGLRASALLAKPEWTAVLRSGRPPARVEPRVHPDAHRRSSGPRSRRGCSSTCSRRSSTRGSDPEDLPVLPLDVLVGCVGAVVAFFIVVTCGATYPPGLRVEGVEDAAIASGRWPARGPARSSRSGCSTPRSSRASILHSRRRTRSSEALGCEAGVAEIVREAPAVLDDLHRP